MGFRGGMRKKWLSRGGHAENIREKGGVRRNILLKLMKWHNVFILKNLAVN